MQQTREASIKVERDKYTELAKNIAIMFFALSDMSSIDFMYQYSLNW